MKQDTKDTQRIITWTMLVLFVGAILSITPLVRFLEFQGFPPGEEAYMHLGKGQEIATQGISMYTQNMDSFNSYPFHVVLSILTSIMNEYSVAILLPILLGVITTFCVYNLLKLFFPTRKQRLLATIFFIMSPIFVITFSKLGTITWITIIIALGLWCLTQKGWKEKCSYPILALLLFHEIPHIVIGTIFVFVIAKKIQKKKEATIITAILSIGILVKLLLEQSKLSFSVPSIITSVQLLFTDVGAQFGFSLFAVILSIVGIQYLWRENKINIPQIMIAILLLIAIITVNNTYAAYCNIFISCIAAVGFLRLTKREWKIQQLRNITLFLLILGVVYSGTATITQGANDIPGPEVMSGMSWLSQHTDEKAVILTNDPFTEIVKQQTAASVLTLPILDEKQTNNKEDSMRELLLSRRIDVTMTIIEEHNIEYITLIDTKYMKWQEREDGLIFLLENGENFKKQFENNKVTVWEITMEREK
jgi:hypothetical protein